MRVEALLLRGREEEERAAEGRTQRGGQRAWWLVGSTHGAWCESVIALVETSALVQSCRQCGFGWRRAAGKRGGETRQGAARPVARAEGNQQARGQQARGQQARGRAAVRVSRARQPCAGSLFEGGRSHEIVIHEVEDEVEARRLRNDLRNREESEAHVSVARGG